MLILSADSCCDICLDPYSNEGAKAPASLGCGHTFCRSCLYTLGSRVCPVCRSPFNVTDDMRKLHVDLESRFSDDITRQEMRALESCRSGDLILMQEGVSEIEQWLQSQSPGFRCSLSTVVALVRLLMEATSQLHEALERSQMDEKTLKMRQELDSMKAAAERRSLQQETEALRVGMVRQREHLAYLESELAKSRANTAAAIQVPIVITPAPAKKTRPALPKPPSTTAPLQPSNPSPATPLALRVVMQASNPQSRPASPTRTMPNSSPLTNSNKIHFTVNPLKTSRPTTPSRMAPLENSTGPTINPPVVVKPSRPTTPTRVASNSLPLIDSNLSTFVLNPPVRHISRSGLHGPRERTPTGEGAGSVSFRPPGAAPSAFTPANRPSLRTAESLESLRSLALEQRRTSLPVPTRPQAQALLYSYDGSTRRPRYSAQPTSWRPVEMSETSQENRSPVDDWDRSSLAYLRSVESNEPPPARPSRSQPPSTIDSPSLSRKRALRRHPGPKDALL